MSRLQEDLKPQEVLSLPDPDGRKFSISNSGVNISMDDLQSVLLRFNLGLPIAGTRSIEPLIKVLNSEFDTVSFEEPDWTVQQPFSKPEYDQAKRNFIKILNKHSQTKVPNFNKEGALKNKVVSGIIKVVNNPQNQMALHTPIAMDEPQKAAENSKAGEEALHACSDNPATKFIMQAQNMVGKEVIGLTAVSLKVFFAVSTYLNNEISKINSGMLDSEVVSLLNKCVVEDPINKGNYKVYANLNFHDLIDRYSVITRFLSADQWQPWMVTEKGQRIDLHKELLNLQEKSDRINAADAESALLSAATDNAKELILAKINASSKFVDIYTYLLSIGTPFGEIANIMTSDIFNKVVKLTETNIFDEDTDSFALESALDFYLNRKPLKFVDKQCLRYLVDPKFENDNWIDLLSDNNVVNQLLSDNNYGKQIKEYISSDDIDFDYDDYGDYSDSEIEEYSDEDEGKSYRDFNSQPITSSEWRKLLKFLELVRERNIEIDKLENKEEQTQFLVTIADRIVPAMKEMELLGGMLGINQGMRTDNYDKFSYIQRIERFINDRFETNKKIIDKFNLMDFLSDSDVRNKMIANYETVKTTYNILDVITRVPHFASMFDLLYMDNYLIKGFSTKTQLERKLASELKTGQIKSLNQKEFKEISNYVNDVLIYNWISTMEEPMTIAVPLGESYYTASGNTEVNNGQILELPLNSTHGVATFKKIVEKHIIPLLKEHPDFKDNYFIRSLSKSIIEERNGEVREFYRLPLQMMNIDSSPKTMMIYENILQAFDEISNTSVPEFGWKIGDLFYLYNLLVHKDSFGQNSMTRLFENLVGSKNSTFLINSYYDFISKLDNTDLKDKLEYNIDDLKQRIHTRVKGTRIKPGTIYVDKNISDFTLNMPGLIRKGAHVIQDKVDKIRDTQNVYYKIKRDDRSVIRGLSDHLGEVYGHGFHIVTSRSVKDEFADDPNCWGAKAFISNGEVYVNVDYANITDPLHEFAHIILAGLKWNPEYAQVYYTALSAITDHPEFDNYASMYPNKHGSDLQEEVFVQILQKYLDNTITEWDDDITIHDLNDGLLEAINRVLGINANESLFDLGATDLETLLNVFKSSLFDHKYNDVIDLSWVVTNQKTATLKNKYVEENKLEQECN